MIRAALLVGLLTAPAWAESYPEATSIVSVGGPLTEIVYALGASDRLVARDTTSLFPPEAQALPDVGYMRRLSAEGVLSVGPDLILARDTSGPPEVLDQLRAASVPVVLVHDGFTSEASVAAIRAVGEALGMQAEAETLAATTEAELAALAADVARVAQPLRVMFVLSTQAGRLNVAGAETGADGLIRLAGAVNVMGAEFQGYKLVNDEAVIAAQPEVVIMMQGEDQHEAKADEILGLPSLTQTPAGQARAFVTVDPAALGFGPRLAALSRDLHDRLYQGTVTQ